MVAEANIETSRRLIVEAFSDGRLELLDELCADGFVSHDPLAGDQDVEGVRQTIAGYREAFPDLAFTIDDIFAAGDKVVMRWTGVGTFQNEFMGLQPTGERGDSVQGMNIDRYDADGKLAETWGQWDTLTLMRDIGAIPAAEAATQS